MSRRDFREAAETILGNRSYGEARRLLRERLVDQLIDMDITDRELEHEIVNQLRAAEMHHRTIEELARTGDVVELDALRKGVV